jgi:cytochrome b6-f complex iron-sulfur subunit
MSERAYGVDGPAPERLEDPGRRRVLNWFLGTSFGALLLAVLYPVGRFLNPPEVETAATNEADAGVTNDPEFLEKGYKIVRFGAEPVIVIRVSDTEFRAFSAVCTHLACIVEYSKARKGIECNCHNGRFNLQGQVTGGPPPRPLAPFNVHLVAQSGGPSRVIVARA